MGRAVCVHFEYALPLMERWFEITHRRAYEWHLEVTYTTTRPAQIITIRTEAGTQKWDAADPLPLGAVKVDGPRPGYVGVLVAVT
jgi:hypothetical protein